MTIQEVAEVATTAAAPAALTVQALAAILIPAVVQILKMLIPKLEGQALFYANLVLNLAVAIGVWQGLDMPAAAALTIGLGGAFAGSKMVDLKKHGVATSSRHR